MCHKLEFFAKLKKVVEVKKYASILVLALVYFSIGIMWAIQKDKVDLEHGLGLVAACTSLAGTIWIMMGVWLSQDEIFVLNKVKLKSPKLVAAMKGFFLEAHHQLKIGALLLGLGFAAQIVSVLAAIFKW